MVMSTLWSPSRVEMRTAWLEVLGTGACSGREYHSARERRPRENTPPSPTGTHTHACSGQHANIHPYSVCVSISHLFTPTCFPSRCPTPHLMSLGCHRHCRPLRLSSPFPRLCTTSTPSPLRVLCMCGPAPALSERCVRCL